MPRLPAIALLALLLTGCRSPERNPGGDLPSHAEVGRLFGVSGCRILRKPIDSAPGVPVSVKIPIGATEYRVDLRPYSVRAEGYRVLVVDADGNVTPWGAGPVRTLRGSVWGRPRCAVAGAMLRDGLHLLIRLENGQRCWMEPVTLPRAPAHTYAIFEDDDILPCGGVCRTPGADQPDPDAGTGPTHLAQAEPLLIARLACDTDVEFVTTHGSASGAEARINAIVNAVNMQYERQVGIRHEISTIVIRTASDPYTAADAQDRLCQLIGEWTANRSGIERDVTHLFTGADLSGGTIGIAADIGGTGICVSDGGCAGGRFGTFGSYCLAQTDFSGSFACVTDLTAHELGHLWGAFHCTCPDSTMNPGVTCTNVFGAQSIGSILRYRQTRDCLEELQTDS